MLLSAACAVAPPAAARERLGDAAHAYELEQHANVEVSLQYDCLRSVETARDDERFELQRISNRLAGTWSQVQYLRALLDASIAADPANEEDLRTALHDHAQFVLGEIDRAQEDLEGDAFDTERPETLQMNAAIRVFLSRLRDTVSRL